MSEYTTRQILDMIEEKENDGPEGLDLSGKRLVGIYLSRGAIQEEWTRARETNPQEEPKWLSRSISSFGPGRTVRWMAVTKDMRPAKARLRGANLARVSFQGADLSDADLHGANLGEADFGEKAKLVNAELKETDLSRAKLQRAKLRMVNLQYANLFRTELQETDLSDASLQEANLMWANL